MKSEISLLLKIIFSYHVGFFVSTTRLEAILPFPSFPFTLSIKVIFSDEIIERLIDLIMEAQQQENTRLPVLKEQLRDTEKRLANLLEAIEQGILTPTTKQRLDELEARKEALNTSILEEELKKPVLTREWMRFWFEKFRKGDMRDMEHQRQIIDTFVNSVYVFDDRVVLNFNFTDDSKTISREEVLGSSAVENAPPHPQTIWSGDFFVVDGTGREQGGSAVSGLQISLYRRCFFLDGCGILGLVQQIGIYKGEY